MARNADGEIDEIWADNGDTATPPVTFDEGWDITYSQTGGPKPERTSFNFLLKQLYAMGLDISQYGGSLPYSQTIDFLPDGIVTEAGVLYICLLANGPASAVKTPGVAGSETFWTDASGGDGAADIQTFTASGTWNKPSEGSMALVECWAGGASGGRGIASGAGAGGGGGYHFEYFDLSTLGASETVTVGAGGAAQTVSNTPGNVGGNTTFGAHLTAYGGGGGGASELGGGGGGGQTSAGGTGSTVSGAGGGPAGGPGLAAVEESAISISGGSGGSLGTSTFNGGDGIEGGGGGAGGYGSAGASPKDGGNSLNGGAGGGSGAVDTSGGSGGSSVYGGNGGAGGAGTNVATDGVQPGGGGGGSANANSGSGAAGQVKVTVW